MFNSGGTIQSLEYNETGVQNAVHVEVKGGGIFLAFSNVKPEKCFLNGDGVGFEWSGDGKLTLSLPWNEDAGGISDVVGSEDVKLGGIRVLTDSSGDMSTLLSLANP
ncbi:hypothetical protein RJ640_021718, partial [Escallonia rubra]